MRAFFRKSGNEPDDHASNLTFFLTGTVDNITEDSTPQAQNVHCRRFISTRAVQNHVDNFGEKAERRGKVIDFFLFDQITGNHLV